MVGAGTRPGRDSDSATTTSADTCGLDVQIRVQSDTRKCSEHTRYPFFGLALPILKTKTEEDQKNKNKNVKQTEKDREDYTGQGLSRAGGRMELSCLGPEA